MLERLKKMKNRMEKIDKIFFWLLVVVICLDIITCSPFSTLIRDMVFLVITFSLPTFINFIREKRKGNKA